ncbi:MAG: carboxypeptidase regulatory-like domain-containing protein [Chloroflexota bacterium]
MKCNKHTVITIAFIFLLLTALLYGCQFNVTGDGTPSSSASYPIPPTPPPQPMAEIFFAATIPTPLLADETLVLSIVDEVTGLALNPTNYVMQSGDSLHYYVAIPLVVNSVVKYRYVRQSGTPIIEDKSNDQVVRYRLYFVGGPGEVMDTISSWSDSAFLGEVGRITGRVVSSTDGNGLPEILISAGGAQTLSDSNGEFVLEGLPPGTQNLVAYSLDGRYQTFQQGALISANKRTPVNLSMTPALLVNVVFTVIVPGNTIPTAPIRFAGNLYQLGNSFGDLEGGINGVAAKMPVLSPMLDGRYTLSLMLPAGADIHYKYTLGDGLWNAEHQIDGNFKIRQLIVPNSDGFVQDVIDTWQSGPSAPILFEVTAPYDTPRTDIVSIQFNPYNWTEPLQMWPLGNNRWVYQLFSPLDMLDSFEYRYCRNDQCGIADDSVTPGNVLGRKIATSLTPQNIQDTINSWEWFSNESTEINQVSNVYSKNFDFWAGVEFQDDYNPSEQPWLTHALQDIRNMGSNWVVLSPSWTYTGMNPSEFSLIPGQDPLGIDVSTTINQAHALNLNTAIFPSVNFPISADDWWMSASRDLNWWDAWFARYRAYSLYYADLAMANSAQALILGGDWVGPALPGGILSDGSSSNIPADTETRWSRLIAEVRQHFDGLVFWAVDYPGGIFNAPGLIYEVDGIYLLWHAPLSNVDNPSIEDLQISAGEKLDNEIRSIQSTFQKPLVLSVAYPAITGTSKACIPDSSGGCQPWYSLNQPISDFDLIELNLQDQYNVYLALLMSINERDWVNGFISRGYYPPVALQDPSASINGKPTAGLLSYWYPRLLGTVK